MNWSNYQKHIFEKALNTNFNIAVSATAGSGKTSTIVETSRRLSLKYPYKSILFSSFGKDIVNELKTKIPDTIDCFTIHSLGMRALMNHFKTNLRVDDFKTFKFADSILKDIKFKGNKKDVYKFTLSDIINLSRLTLTEEKEEAIEELCDTYDISITNDEIKHSLELLTNLKKYNKKLSKTNNLIDFTDMVNLPATDDKIKLKQYDIVLLDEAQDCNKSQHLFIEKLLKPSGRLISVGDKKQAIYSFAGSDAKSFELFENRINTITMPLSICYRCTKNIVINAQQINEEIQFDESQEDGLEPRYGTFNEIKINDIVVCRNTKPLIFLYFKLLENNQKSFIRGREIEQGLLKIYLKIKDTDKYSARVIFEEMLLKLHQQLEFRGVKKPKDHLKYRNLKEKITILNILLRKCKYVFEVESKIKELFENKINSIQLMTSHKSKGLENDRVFFIEQFNGKKLIPSKYATTDQEKEQENNLLFVSLTRAKKELIYLKLNDEDEE